MSPARGHSKNRAPMPAAGEQRSSQARRSRRFFEPAPGEAPTSWRGPICADEIPSTPCQRGVPRMLTFRGLFFFAAEKVPFSRLRGALRAGIQPDGSRWERIAAVPGDSTRSAAGALVVLLTTVTMRVSSASQDFRADLRLDRAFTPSITPLRAAICPTSYKSTM